MAEMKRLPGERGRLSAAGGSDLHVNASQELSGNISGGGNVYYSGNPEKLDIMARGGSKTIEE